MHLHTSEVFSAPARFAAAHSFLHPVCPLWTLCLKCMEPVTFLATKLCSPCTGWLRQLQHLMAVAGEDEDQVLQNIANPVAKEDKRPPIPSNMPPPISDLMRECWQKNPMRRPGFPEIAARLEKYSAEQGEQALHSVADALMSWVISRLQCYGWRVFASPMHAAHSLSQIGWQMPVVV